MTLQIQKTRKLAILMLSILKLNTKLKIRTMYCAYAVNLAYSVKTKGFEFWPVFLVLLSSQLMFFFIQILYQRRAIWESTSFVSLSVLCCPSIAVASMGPKYLIFILYFKDFFLLIFSSPWCKLKLWNSVVEALFVLWFGWGRMDQIYLEKRNE